MGVCSSKPDSEADTYKRDDHKETDITTANRLRFAQIVQARLASELRYISDVTSGTAPRRHDQPIDVFAKAISSAGKALEGILPGTILLSAIAAGITKFTDRKFTKTIRGIYNKFLDLMGQDQETFIRKFAIELANIYNGPLSEIETDDVNLVAEDAVSHMLNYMAARPSLDGFTRDHLIRGVRQGYSGREESLVLSITNTRLKSRDGDKTRTSQGLLKRSGIKIDGVEYTHDKEDRSEKYRYAEVNGELGKLFLHEKDGWRKKAPESPKSAASSASSSGVESAASTHAAKVSDWSKDLPALEEVGAQAIPEESAFLEECERHTDEIQEMSAGRLKFLQKMIKDDPTYLAQLQAFNVLANLSPEERSKRRAEGRTEYERKYYEAIAAGSKNLAEEYLEVLGSKFQATLLNSSDIHEPTPEEAYSYLEANEEVWVTVNQANTNFTKLVNAINEKARLSIEEATLLKKAAEERQSASNSNIALTSKRYTTGITDSTGTGANLMQVA